MRDGSIKIGYVLASDQKLDRTCASALTRNEATFLEGHDHVVDRWGRNTEVSLEVSLRRRLPNNFRVVVDEREILALFRRQIWSRIQ
mgnify:FL=1